MSMATSNRSSRARSAHISSSVLRKHIALAAEENSRNVDFDALFARIERGIAEAPAPGRRERVSVWTREQFEHRPARLWLPAAGVLAAAAAVLLLLRGVPGSIDDRPSAANPQIDIEQIAFNDDYGGTIFEVALADGASTKVVWINDYDDDDDEGDEVLQ
jgi:hypothetical protein